MEELFDPEPEIIAANITEVRERIANACARAGRSEDEVTLVAVTKTHPIERVRAAFAAGLRDFGENRVQELVAKAQAFPGALDSGAHRWHLIGHLQSNKARDAVRYADVFHGLDTLRLAEELQARAERAGRVIDCLVQVNVSGELSKFGVTPSDVHRFLERMAPFEHLRVCGLMAIAAPARDPEDVRGQFRLLRQTMNNFPRAKNPFCDLRILSMGMSGDFEVAIEEGATHVRIGSAIFGEREG